MTLKSVCLLLVSLSAVVHLGSAGVIADNTYDHEIPIPNIELKDKHWYPADKAKEVVKHVGESVYLEGKKGEETEKLVMEVAREKAVDHVRDVGTEILVGAYHEGAYHEKANHEGAYHEGANHEGASHEGAYHEGGYHENESPLETIKKGKEVIKEDIKELVHDKVKLIVDTKSAMKNAVHKIFG